ncbi:outer membrane beta-barrel protein [uncultured Bartonella sp.]|uniref:outer membrane protein n=1 Tax=uncultured Bartonella sp. TaxID=104108 RepID=UPI002604DF97|nr:outer membrane beta-barrel protein [uncultured Bartonella sp.]
MKFFSTLVGALSLFSVVSAHATDIDLDKVPEVAISTESFPFYFKGYTGAEIGKINKIVTLNSAAEPANYRQNSHSDMDNAFLGGIGLGYRLNDISRFDGTIEYRAKNTVTKSEQSPKYLTKYEGDVASTVIMANAYVDLLTYHNITPFIGAGIGASANQASGFTVDTSIDDYKASSKTKWDVAWALHAGFGIKLSRNVIFDIAYSYTDLGEARTSEFDGMNVIKLDHLTSHDVKFGIRYAFK